jgi:hypothetical protein
VLAARFPLPAALEAGVVVTALHTGNAVPMTDCRMTYVAAADRYERIPYRHSGRSGLMLPEVSLGLWQNFGDDRPLDAQREIIRRAFDLGVTHFDLANNYGPPYF